MPRPGNQRLLAARGVTTLVPPRAFHDTLGCPAALSFQLVRRGVRALTIIASRDDLANAATFSRPIPWGSILFFNCNLSSLHCDST